jgi:hypothetical protein
MLKSQCNTNTYIFILQLSTFLSNFFFSEFIERNEYEIKYGSSIFVPCQYREYVDDRTINEHGALGEMRIGRRNRNTREKPAPVPFYPFQTPHDVTRDRTQGTEVEIRLLTAITMAPPLACQVKR